MRVLAGLTLWLVALMLNSGSKIASATAPGVLDPPPLGLDLYRPVPVDNPLTPEKIALGRRLFQDGRLSRDGTRACAGCHIPARAFADGRVIAVGVGGQAGRRNVPTLVNRVYGASFFWDGRADTLEQQVLQPLLSPQEMGANAGAVVTDLTRDGRYRRQFAAAFGRPPSLDDIARALASYVRTIQSGNSRYDRYRNGATMALSGQEVAGMRVFFGKGHCGSCHAGPSLTDERFHNTGVAFRDGTPLDLGRFVVSGRPGDRGAFKTPTLREVALTAPYMHDGSLATLEDVVGYYNRGGNANAGLDSILRPLSLSVEDKDALVAFMRTLNGTVVEGQ